MSCNQDGSLGDSCTEVAFRHPISYGGLVRLHLTVVGCGGDHQWDGLDGAVD